MVFATITAEGYVNAKDSSQVVCIFNHNDGACNYGVGVGIIAFFASTAFLFADAYLPLMSSAQERKHLVMVDLGFSGKTEHNIITAHNDQKWKKETSPTLTHN